VISLCKRLLQEEQETDVTLCVGPVFRLKAHRAVLLARAPHLLLGTEPTAPVIHLQGTEPAALKDFIQYIMAFLYYSSQPT